MPQVVRTYYLVCLRPGRWQCLSSRFCEPNSQSLCAQRVSVDMPFRMRCSTNSRVHRPVSKYASLPTHPSPWARAQGPFITRSATQDKMFVNQLGQFVRNTAHPCSLELHTSFNVFVDFVSADRKAVSCTSSYS